MTVVLQKSKTKRKFTGLSSDDKPALSFEDVGDEFYETDTSELFEWYGSSWKVPTTVTEIPPIELGAPVGQAKRTEFITDILLYRAEAVPGTVDSDSVWRIRKIILEPIIIEMWADGTSDYTKIWDNKLTYTYDN